MKNSVCITMFFLIIFTLLLICVQDILCLEKVYCDPNDDRCLTNSVNERVFPMLMAGMPSVEPSEPLHLNKLEVNLPDLKYTLFNATMTGVKDCEIYVKKNAADTLFDYEPCCPRLTIESQYEADGKIDTVSVKGKGSFKITYENYFIKIIGKQVKVKKEDSKHYVNILNYIIDLDLKGKSAYDYKNLTFGDKGKCKCTAALRSKYFDRLEEITRTPIMEAFVNTIMDKVKDLHAAVPVEEMYFKYV